jgi:hypothetical protein
MTLGTGWDLNLLGRRAYHRPMRRLGILVLGLLAGLCLAAEPALATFHLNLVNEVMLDSSGGDPSVQFVELLDHGGTEEAFPPVFAPFKLTVYDAAGNKLGEQTLDPAKLRAAAAADKEYLISTPTADAAFGVTADEKLTVTLPQGAGQACFEGNPGTVSCMTWGTITKPVTMSSNGTGAVHGPVPANGQSDQRLSDNSVVAAAPTPKARNKAPSGGGGGGGGGGGAFAGVGFPSASARVDAKGRAHVAVSCPAGSGGCSGKLTLNSGKKTIGSAKFTVAAGASKKVAVKLSAAARTRLAKHGSLKARAVAMAKDAAGAGQRSSAAIVLK